MTMPPEDDKTSAPQAGSEAATGASASGASGSPPAAAPAVPEIVQQGDAHEIQPAKPADPTSEIGEDARSNDMAIPTAVNGQITDAVTQANLTVIGNAPALTAMAMLNSQAQASGLAMLNAVNAQQQLNVSAQTATMLAILKAFST